MSGDDGRREAMLPVVIVGSGPAGVSAAWPLVEAGIQVLMVDASSQISKPLPAPPQGDIALFRRDPQRWRTQFGVDLAGLAAIGDHSPKLATPRARNVLAGFAAATGLVTQDFLACGSLGRGGLSQIWGALAAVYDERDLVDFPFNQVDLLPSYAAVAERIGLSGPTIDGVATAAGPALIPPARKVLDAHLRGGPRTGMHLEVSTNAVLMGPRNGREGCSECGLCLWGCARGSIYSSGPEIDQLRHFSNFRYRPGLAINQVEANGTGHAVISGRDSSVEMITARRVLLAAGTIASTTLAVRRLGLIGEDIPLLSNPVAAMAFVLPALFAMPLPERSFALAQLAFTVDLPQGERCAGALYGADTLPLAAIACRMPLSRPLSLRLSRALAPALLLATVYLPGRFSENRFRLSTIGQSQTVTIAGLQPLATMAALRTAGSLLAKGMRRLGAFALPRSFSAAAPGGDAHYAGTMPMGGRDRRGTSVVGEVKGCSGLHIVDGAVLPSLPARHCTFTIMANADRIGRELARRICAED